MLICALSKEPMRATAVRFALILVGVLALMNTEGLAQTVISVGSSPRMSSVKRLGVNLGGQDFYDSQQLMRNIMFRNPGFEGERWQSIVHCAIVTPVTCTDDDVYATWPANFFNAANNATAEFIVGGAAGVTVGVTTNLPAVPLVGAGITLTFAKPPAGLRAGDYAVVRMTVPGNAAAGWWPYLQGGATIATEFLDLSPNTPGVQALRLTATGSNQFAVLHGYTDTSSQPFIQMKGGYTLTFRAKGTGGTNQVTLGVGRNQPGGKSIHFFNQTVTLAPTWNDYSYYFQASNDTGIGGSVDLSFLLQSSAMLIDDVALTADAAPNNPTAYRDEVVSTLQALNPGILRYMDSGTNFGSSLDNMLASPFARVRSGFSAWSTESDDISMGLHDFLVLCQTIGAEPWYTMQAGMTTQEMSNLMDYLGGSTSTVYGAKRAALGQVQPWTSVFPTIHLEFGNETWNNSFAGENYTTAAGYGSRASAMFAVARASPSYSSKSFDLVINGWAAIPYWSQGVISASANYDTIDAAPYLFNTFNDASSTENIFGPMFAQPESWDSLSTGVMNQQAQLAAAANPPAKLAVYETNLSTTSGSATQSQINQTVPTLGAGLAATEHMLLMMRDLGINSQSAFSLGGYQFNFNGTKTSSAATTPLWGLVVDMGVTNRVRPSFLAQQLANSAILPTLLTTSQSGANPTWNQPLSTNDNISLAGAHYIQSFAFTDGTQNNLILFNLHRTQPLTVTFSGANAPLGSANITTLTASSITAGNEQSTNVSTSTSSRTLQPGATVTLAPFSMTVINTPAPAAPTITSITASCAAASLSGAASTPCSATVTGTGSFSSGVSWQVNRGSISSTGVYTAPASNPTGSVATITATSTQDTNQTASTTINLVPSGVSSVSLSCAATSVLQGATTACSATVQGVGSFSSAINWSTTAGTIDAKGNLTAPATGTSLIVTATSQQDPTKSASLTITLLPSSTITSVAITCGVTSLSPSASTSCAASVAGTGNFSSGVVWSISAGSITQSGVVTAPASGSSITVQAVSQQDPTKIGYATIALTSTNTITGVSLVCNTNILGYYAKTTCAATVTGTGSFSPAVTWSTSAGTISQSGIITAPGSGSSLTVRATSQQDVTKSGTKAITLTSSSIKSVSVLCQASSLAYGATTNCAATVAGSGSFSKAVTWSTSAGTIDAYGNLTAPSSGSSITVQAVSQQDSSRSGSQSLTLFSSGPVQLSVPTIVKTATTATISWRTNVPTRSGVDYGTTNSYGATTAFVNTPTTTPSFTLTGLKPNTLYYILIWSINPLNNNSATAAYTFTTP